MVKQISARRALISVMMASTAIGSASFAQDAADDTSNDGIEEITVTVERRSQSLQDLAGTAAVFSGEDLKAIGVQNLQGLDGKIPGLSIANNQGSIEVYIRGVGSNNVSELIDPAVAFHIDGVYIPRSQALGGAFFDLQRVETNIGPQGTLRGRNATAGTINAISIEPGLGVTDLSFSAGYGNFNEYSAETVINLPVTEDSALRIGAFYRDRDSWLNNINPDSSELGLDVPTSEDEGIGVAEAVEEFGAKASYKIEFLENFTFTLSGDFSSVGGSGYTGVNFAGPLGNGVTPSEIDNPRDVFGRAFTPEEDTEHWGIRG